MGFFEQHFGPDPGTSTSSPVASGDGGGNDLDGKWWLSLFSPLPPVSHHAASRRGLA